MLYQKIKINEIEVDVYKRGSGPINCMVVGAAGLFTREGMWPDGLDGTFTIYFVDFWTENESKSEESYKNLSWNNMTDEIEQARIVLELGSVVVMGQSACGAIAVKYAQRYPGYCRLVVPIAFSPDWSKDKAIAQEKYIEGNATDERKKLISELNEEYVQNSLTMSPKEAFVKTFQAKRGLFWKNCDNAQKHISCMWKTYDPNLERVRTYFEFVLKEYGFFENPLTRVPIFWVLGLYDYSVPPYRLADPLEKLKKQGGFDNLDYYILMSGHYPMVEDPEKFVQVLEEKVKSLGLMQQTPTKSVSLSKYS